MKRFSFRSLFLGLATLCSLTAWATLGPSATGLISGQLFDAQTQEPIPQASVIVLRAADNAYVTTVSTRADGSFSLGQLPYGDYRLGTTVLGYQPFGPVVHLDAQQPQQKLGVLALTPLAPLATVAAANALADRTETAQPAAEQAELRTLISNTLRRNVRYSVRS